MESTLAWEIIDTSGDIYTPRTGHCLAYIDGVFFLFGGIDHVTSQNDLYKMNDKDFIWTKINTSENKPSARSGCQCLTHKNEIYFFGGYKKKGGEYFNDLYALKVTTLTWRKVQTKNNPYPRTDHTFLKFHDHAYVFGGTDGNIKFDDLHELNLEKGEWKLLKKSAIWPSGRFGHSCVRYEDHIYLFGGWDGKMTLNDLWRYSPVFLKWELISEHSSIASRYRHTATIFGSCMYIFGGVDQSQERFGDLIEYSFKTNVWRRVIFENNGPSARTFHKAIVSNGDLFIFGGFDGNRKNDLYRISLKTIQLQSDTISNGGTYTTATNAIPKKISSEQLVKEWNSWIAYIIAKKSNTLIDEDVKNLPINKWYTINPKGNIFSKRTGHIAFVNGDIIYLYGGFDENKLANSDVYAYHIYDNIWERIDTAGIPPCLRSGCKHAHSKNFTDNKIYFFGGYNQSITKISEYFNDMYSFDMQNYTWRKIKYAENSIFPPRRTDHILGFYDNSLFVFGGKGENNNILFDFWKFNLNMLKWSNIQGEGTFVCGRFGHIGIVFEDSLFVFGGWDGVNCLDDLFQYSFHTNIWYDLRRSAGQKPTPRYRHDACIIQQKLYIFGGVNEKQNRFNDLYEYKFLKREWTLIKVSGDIPTPRTFHKIINYENLIFLLGGFDGERKNDMHAIPIKEDEKKEKNIELEKSYNKAEIRMNSMTFDDLESLSKDAAIHILNEQVLELSRKLQKEEERNLCKICFAREIDAILLECCHFVICYICSSELKDVKSFSLLLKCNS